MRITEGNDTRLALSGLLAKMCKTTIQSRKSK